MVSGVRPGERAQAREAPERLAPRGGAVQAQPAGAGQQRRERAQPAGMGEGLEHEAPERPVGGRRVGVALDLSPRVLDQLVVLNARTGRR